LNDGENKGSKSSKTVQRPKSGSGSGEMINPYNRVTQKKVAAKVDSANKSLKVQAISNPRADIIEIRDILCLKKPGQEGSQSF